MTSQATPHTFQSEHYSFTSKLAANFFPAFMIVVGIVGVCIVLNMI